MRLAGLDPFGQAYFDLRSELEEAGIPVYRPLPDWSGHTTDVGADRPAEDRSAESERG